MASLARMIDKCNLITQGHGDTGWRKGERVDRRVGVVCLGGWVSGWGSRQQRRNCEAQRVAQDTLHGAKW